ncbi:uncharacterized protein LOC135402222 isoform X3 [Pseudopipra pipra]|uniref:uncharacterized protein LOC135402222 isoform X3 n=1 Tax=Pseudopipra pipra TaxID=415032 RepID=UPI0031391DA8
MELGLLQVLSSVLLLHRDGLGTPVGPRARGNRSHSPVWGCPRRNDPGEPTVPSLPQCQHVQMHLSHSDLLPIPIPEARVHLQPAWLPQLQRSDAPGRWDPSRSTRTRNQVFSSGTGRNTESSPPHLVATFHWRGGTGCAARTGLERGRRSKNSECWAVGGGRSLPSPKDVMSEKNRQRHLPQTPRRAEQTPGMEQEANQYPKPRLEAPGIPGRGCSGITNLTPGGLFLQIRDCGTNPSGSASLERGWTFPMVWILLILDGGGWTGQQKHREEGWRAGRAGFFWELPSG